LEKKIASSTVSSFAPRDDGARRDLEDLDYFRAREGTSAR